MNDTPTPDPVEQRVRHTLSVVAAAVTTDALAPSTRPSDTRKPHRKRRIGIGIGALAVPVAVAASAFVHEGSEYVAPIPQDRIVMTGSIDGSHYLLAETDRTGECGQPVTGVELVEEKENLLGSEWNTSGYEYGEMVETDCGYVNDTSRYLKYPALFIASGSQVGDSFVWVYGVHPRVDTVRITSDDYTKDLKVYEVDGAGYAPFEIPKGMKTYISELVIDGHAVPGSTEEHTVPRP